MEQLVAVLVPEQVLVAVAALVADYVALVLAFVACSQVAVAAATLAATLQPLIAVAKLLQSLTVAATKPDTAF